MESLNKRIISFSLASALAFSTLPAAEASYTKAGTNATVQSVVDMDGVNGIYRNSGLYGAVVNDRLVYVFLGNDRINKYVTKGQALMIGNNNYRSFSVFRKTVINPRYVPGVTPENEKFISVYALSEKNEVTGWVRVPKESLRSDEYVATSLELGEFLLKNIDLSTYNKSMLGFAYMDVNKDGISDELIYLGNNSENKFLSKTDAFNWASNVYKNYYIYSKLVDNPNYVPGVNNSKVIVYTISNQGYLYGWNRIGKSDVPNNAYIGTNPTFVDAYMYVATKIKKAPEVDRPVEDKPVASFGAVLKKQALDYAYSNYPYFCILTRKVYNKTTNTSTIIYAFSTTTKVAGWTIIGNELIPDNGYIFLNMESANKYIYSVENSYSRTLN